MRELKTERLLLRPIGLDDSAAPLTHPHVRRYIFGNKPIAKEQVAWLVEGNERDFTARDYGLWAMFDGARMLGGCVLVIINVEVQLRYTLESDCWDGLAGEASAAVLSDDFEVSDPEEADVANAASIRLAKRLGRRHVSVWQSELAPLPFYSLSRR
ncbi:GNAT family N-acetyltransferase [Streptosporangium canum]|uniref:GNAT family N-acetyltransferase n=1 Tax=Streptosporangium canum TaxID=324952 RepID=UPI00379B6AAC